jgi:energy-converting hydrogenase Eha subunit E
LPGVLFGVLYLWSWWQFAKLMLGSGWLFLGAVALTGAAALRWGWFVRADGVGTGLALEVCAVWLALRYLKWNHEVDLINLNLAGACLGLSVAARLDFAIPAAALALALLAVLGMQRQWTGWIDRVMIPAIVVALVFLVLPLSHAHATREITPELTAGQARLLQSALQVLRSSAGPDPIRIGTIPAVEPVVNFYRAQQRARAWERASRDFRSGPFDYYLLPAAEGNWAEQRHLLVLYRDADFLLARSSYAPM